MTNLMARKATIVATLLAVFVLVILLAAIMAISPIERTAYAMDYYDLAVNPGSVSATSYTLPSVSASTPYGGMDIYSMTGYWTKPDGKVLNIPGKDANHQFQGGITVSGDTTGYGGYTYHANQLDHTDADGTPHEVSPATVSGSVQYPDWYARTGATVTFWLNSPQYTVTFDKNTTDEVEGLSSNSTTVTPGASVTLPTLVRAGYTFNGWYTETSGGTKRGDGGQSYTPSSGETIHAQWTPLPATEPTISATSGATVTYGYSSQSISVTATASSGHTVSGYQWYDNGTTDDNTGGDAIGGATNDSYAFPTGKDAGTYYYYCVVTATRTDNGQTATTTSSAIAVTVDRADITPTVTMSGWTYGETASDPSVSGNLGSGAVTYQYKVSTAADETYTEDKPSASGTYTVKATIAATTNYNGNTATADFTIANAQSDIDDAPAIIDGLIYSGTDQALVTAGTATHGTLMYRIGTSGGWSSSIPAAKNAGTYHVYYYVQGDQYYDDWNGGDENGQMLTVTVAQKAITVTVVSKTGVYGDEPKGLEGTTIEGAVYNGDTGVYSLSCTATSTSDVGSYDIVGTDTSDNYDVTFVNGVNAYLVTKRPITVTAENKSIREGDALPTYTFVTSDMITKEVRSELNEKIIITSTADVKTPKMYDIVVAFKGEYTSETVLQNYTVTLKNGSLSVLPKVLSIDEVEVFFENEDDAFDLDIFMEVEVKTNLEAEEAQGIDYNAISAKYLDKKSEISTVYSVKLLQTIISGGVETTKEIQPSDIKAGATIIVKMDIPKRLQAKSFRILHIHSAEDIEYVDSSMIEIKDGCVYVRVTKLSEFAFVNYKDNAILGHKGLCPGWIVVILDVILAVCFIVFLLMRRKSTQNLIGLAFSAQLLLFALITLILHLCIISTVGLALAALLFIGFLALFLIGEQPNEYA